MKIIYNYVKQGKQVPKDLWDKTVETLNVDAIILGCTELSILKKDFKKVFAVKIYFQVLKEKIIFPETLSVKD